LLNSRKNSGGLPFNASRWVRKSFGITLLQWVGFFFERSLQIDSF
jgi:hypothetical protein